MVKQVYISIFILFLCTSNSVLCQSTGDYRSKQSGIWTTVAIWQTFDGSNWINATAAPTSANGTITILSGHTITSSSNLTVDQVVVNSGGTLTISNGTFSLNAASAVDLICNGMLSQTNGTINGSGNIAINSGGLFDLAGGAYNGSGTMTINTGAEFDMSGGLLTMSQTKIVNNYGTCLWTDASFNFTTGATAFNNYGTFNFYTDRDISSSGVTGSFNNKASGIINKIGSPDDATTFNGTMSFANEGTININSSTIRLYVGSLHSGIVNIDFGAHLAFFLGNAYFNTGTNIAGDGYLDFEGGADTLYTGTINVGNITLGNATVYNGGNIIMGDGSVFNQTNGRLTGSGVVSLNSGSSYNWTGGYNSGTGTINVASGADMVIDGTVYLTESKTINNYGTCTWTNGNILFGNAPVFNNYGTFAINTDTNLQQTSSTTGTFNNMASGLLTKTGSPLAETSFSGISQLTNAGTIHVLSSGLQLNIGSLNSGSINVEAGGNMNFSGGNSIFNAGTVLSGDGIVNFENGNDTINSATVSVAHINISGGIVYNATSMNMGNGAELTLTGGTLNGPGTISFPSGSEFNWDGGNLGGSGILAINSGASLNQTGTVYLLDSRIINNYGIWNWTGGTFYFNASPVVNNYGIFSIVNDVGMYNSSTTTGVFNNMPSGTVTSTGSPTGSTRIQGLSSFNNAGAVMILSGELVLNLSGMHTGSYNIGYGSTLSGNITMNFTGNTFLNDGTVMLTGLTFGGSATQSLDGAGVINTLTINNPVGVLLTDMQTVNVAVTVKSNGKLIVYKDIIVQ